MIISERAGYISPELYPFSGNFLDRKGWAYHYLDEGAEDADPVVMVHGNPSWSITYRHLVQELKRDHRTIVPDHIGCGLSDKPPATSYGYRLADRVADLTALINSLQFKKPITLIAHDWGGMIAMAYAVQQHERIARIVLFNTAAFHLPQHMRIPTAITAVRNTPLGALAVQGFNAFAKSAARVGCKRHPMSRKLRNAYCAPYNTWDNRLATLRFVQDIPVRPTDASYNDVSEVEANLSLFSTVPILLAWGMRDFVFTGEVLNLFTEIWPHAEVERYDDCGHYVQEDAAPEVTLRVRQFLNAHTLPA